MTFPTRPTIDIPRWCLLGSKTQPNPYGTPGSGGYEDTGWLQVPGQNYGQIPPYQWVNWLQYSVGEWLDWLCSPTVTTTTGAMEYIKEGNFDNGINSSDNILIKNGKSIRLYESTNTNYIGISPPLSLPTGNNNYVFPNRYPATVGQALICDTAGNLVWENNTTTILYAGQTSLINITSGNLLFQSFDGAINLFGGGPFPYNSVTGVFTAPISTVYEFNLLITNPTVFTGFFLYFYRNGSQMNTISLNPQTTYNYVIKLPLSAGDTAYFVGKDIEYGSTSDVCRLTITWINI